MDLARTVSKFMLVALRNFTFLTEIWKNAFSIGHEKFIDSVIVIMTGGPVCSTIGLHCS